MTNSMRKQSRHQAEAQVAFLEEILGSQPFETALDYGAADSELLPNVTAKMQIALRYGAGSPLR